MPENTRRVHNEPATCKMNMTPMIDVVFQLLIFFILVTELQNIVTEELALPKADQAIADVNPPAGRTIINVTLNRSGQEQIWVMGSRYGLDALGARLKAEAEIYKEGAFSAKPVLIRADMKAQYRAVQDVMKKCIQSNIWRLSFGASRTDA